MERSGSSGHKNRILAVDDERFNLEIIAEYLGECDYELITAENGESAWDILESEQETIDLVLLDRMLPDMDGMEILSRIKQHPVFKHTPVIIQTAKASKQDIIQGMQAGAFYYLTKPFDEEILKSIVKTALNDHQFYCSLQARLDQTSCTLALMYSGSFRFRTLEEAKSLASLIANACPVPDQVLGGLSELMINAVEHGNLGITYAEKSVLLEEERWLDEVSNRLAMAEYSGRYATLEYKRTASHIEITIKDMGDGFDWRDFIEISLDRIADKHGRGIAMAKIMSFDSLEYHGKGNVVTATVDLARASNSTTDLILEEESA